MATILDRLTTILDFKTDTTGVQQAEASLAALKSNSMRVFAAVGTIFGGGFFLNQIARSADETTDFARSIGIAAADLSSLQYAVSITGGQAAGLNQSMYSLNTAIGAADRGLKRSLKVFQDYGIGIKDANGKTKTAIEIFYDINRAFQTLSKTQQLELAQKLGIDQGTVTLLQQTPAEFMRLIARAREMGAVTNEAGDQAGEYLDAITTLKFALGGLAREGFGSVFPRLTKFVDSITAGVAVLKEHSRVIKITGILLGLVATAWAWVRREAILANAAMLLIPAAIAAAIAGLILLIDDLMAFWQGQDSIMGDIEKRWPAAGKIMRATIDFMLVGWDLLKEVLADVGKGFNNMIRIFELATDKLEAFGRTMSRWGGAIKGFFDWFVVDSPDVSAAVNLRAFPQAVPFIPPAGGNSASVSTGDINISVPGGDAKAIAASITDVLGTELRNTVQNFDSGIKY